MQTATIHQLNQINRDFYHRTAASFDATRQQPWPGWSLLTPYLQEVASASSSPTLVDLGCGNGRFAEFVDQTVPGMWEYWGVDQNEVLLEQARQRLTRLNWKNTVLQLDIVSTLLEETSLPIPSVDIIVAFGVLHHIPSFELRQKLLHSLAAQLNPGGYLIISLWQFTQLPSLLKRASTPEKLGIDPVELEPNDYFLDWQRDTAATRYAHLVDTAEKTKLLYNLQLTTVAEFAADGPTHDVNHYIVLQRGVQ